MRKWFRFRKYMNFRVTSLGVTYLTETNSENYSLVAVYEDTVFDVPAHGAG